MMSLMLSASAFFILSCVPMNNPVKMKINLMLASIFMLAGLKWISSSSWMAMIFCMLYLGGILMMFMILSSFLPNTNFKSSNKKKVLPYVILMVVLYTSVVPSSQVSSMKTFMEEKINFLFMTFWILGIFLGFIMMIGDSKNSMRSFLNL